ncbi:MAG: dihydrolipoyl dehydrogenase [Candidatus Asgardarchaeia archaeon]
MKHYDIIAFGTGSAMNIVSELIGMKPNIRVAVIENGLVGGICLTRGCIPSKMLLYPAEVIHETKRLGTFGVTAEIKNIDFNYVISRVRENILHESKMIEESIKADPRLDLYQTTGEFVGDYTVKVGDEIITGDKILLCIGSRPLIPKIEGLEEAGYITNKEILFMKKLPKRLAVIGGGYIAAEFGFFFNMMGSKVTLLEMLPRLVSHEEPEISDLLKKDFESQGITVKTNHKVVAVEKRGDTKVVVAENTETGENIEVEADEILVAAGRRSNADITKPEKTGVKTDKNGWIIVNDYLETTKPNIWACGDALGRYMFKHVANYESQIVFYNAFLGRKMKPDYHAIPHAIFTYPEIASVGMKEEEAAKKHEILVGYYPYEHTAKGEAMAVKDYFVKVIVEKETYRILGAHIIGPHASILLQEIINLMYTNDQSAIPIFRGMHIHPALSEVVERAFFSLREPSDWR